MTVGIGDARRDMPVSIQAVHGNREGVYIISYKDQRYFGSHCSFHKDLHGRRSTTFCMTLLARKSLLNEHSFSIMLGC